MVVLFLSGWITERFGPRSTMTFFLSTTGLFTLLLGALRGPAVTPALLFLQAASVACLFPVGFTVLSLVFPLKLRSVAVSLVMLIAFSVGGGVIPSAHRTLGGSFLLRLRFRPARIVVPGRPSAVLRAGKRLDFK